MVMWPLYRGSGSLVGPVGARPRERGHRPHHLGRRVATAQEIVAETRSGPPAVPAQEGGQAAAASLQAPLRLGRLLEGGGHGGRGQVARNALLRSSWRRRRLPMRRPRARDSAQKRAKDASST